MFKGVEFEVGNEYFVADINSVREVISWQEVSKVPNVPEFVEGIINLRGKVIPVVDLAKRFNFEVKVEPSKRKIMIVQVFGKLVGIIVDNVTRVVDVTDEMIDDTGILQNVADTVAGYLKGVAKIDNKLVMIIDLEALFSPEERKHLEAAADARN